MKKTIIAAIPGILACSREGAGSPAQSGQNGSCAASRLCAAWGEAA